MLSIQALANWLLITIAATALIAIAIQYPLKTTFPMGGDAAFHISLARNPSLLSQTWYPAASLLFSTLHTLPFVDWPEKFTWWMAAGQIAIGTALGLLAYRLGGPLAAAATIGLWAVTPIEMTPFFEDATMPQLWSLPWLFLLYERIASRSFWLAGVAYGLCLTTHPITALVATVALVFGGLALLVSRRPRRLLAPARQHHFSRILGSLLIIIIGIMATYLVWKIVRDDKLALPFTPSSTKYADEMLNGGFAAWLLAAGAGVLIFASHRKTPSSLRILLLALVFVAALLGFNTFLGIGFWPDRTMPYLVAAVTLFAGIFFGRLVPTVIPHPLGHVLFLAPIILLITIGTWQTNANIYKRSETPGTYVRIHPLELEAIHWLENNIFSHAYIYSTPNTRHYEWIPALTDIPWKAMPQDELLKLSANGLHGGNYIIYFTHQELPPDEIRDDRRAYRIVYANKGAVIARPLAP